MQLPLHQFFSGMGIRNSWGLWKGSRLAQWFLYRGVNHPDSMSAIIMAAFRAEMEGLPFHVEEAIEGAREGARRMQEMHEEMERKGREVPEKIAKSMRIRVMIRLCGGSIKTNMNYAASIRIAGSSAAWGRDGKVFSVSTLVMRMGCGSLRGTC